MLVTGNDRMMYDLNLIDETLDIHQSHHYQLSIQTSLNGLSFCILDLVRLKYIAFRNYPDAFNGNMAEGFSAIYESDDLLKLEYKNVYHVSVGENCTLIPKVYFDEQKMASLYQRVFLPTAEEDIHFNYLGDDMVNIYGFPRGLMAALKQRYGEVQSFHHTTSFIGHVLRDAQKAPRHRCYVYLRDDMMNIGVAHQDKMMFFNTFSVQNNSDIIYYILGVLEQFDLSPKFTDVMISADTIRHDEVFSFLNDFLHHIKFIRPSDHFSYSYLLDDLHLTRFANLFNVGLCG